MARRSTVFLRGRTGARPLDGMQLSVAAKCARFRSRSRQRQRLRQERSRKRAVTVARARRIPAHRSKPAVFQFVPPEMISAFITLGDSEIAAACAFTLAMIRSSGRGRRSRLRGSMRKFCANGFATLPTRRRRGCRPAFQPVQRRALAHCAISPWESCPISARRSCFVATAVVPQLGKACARMRPAEDHATPAIQRLRCASSKATCSQIFENPQANPFLPGIADTINRLGLIWSRPIVSVHDDHYHDRRDDVSMWMGDQITERGIGNGCRDYYCCVLAQLRRA